MAQRKISKYKFKNIAIKCILNACNSASIKCTDNKSSNRKYNRLCYISSCTQKRYNRFLKTKITYRVKDLKTNRA